MNNEIKSIKLNKQWKFRKQAQNLCKTGFNDACLLYIITTEPEKSVYGNINDWFIASDRASASLDKIKDKFDFQVNDKFSTIGLFIGSLESMIEPFANSQIHKIFHSVNRDQNNDRQNDFRLAFEKKIGKLFPIEVSLACFPIQIRACSNQSCKNIYPLSRGVQLNCPICGSSPY
ncbi:MAG: hypothetical protein HW421_556 [Ignavibacteria bacterium]|nr:hypothetical protein [Ignavibacteria bacterium]